MAEVQPPACTTTTSAVEQGDVDGTAPLSPAIPDNFGDIMSKRKVSIKLPDDFSPLERIVLTANGNLQRIISSFYNSPVTVEIVKNIPNKAGNVFDREVKLHVLGQVFCVAKSKVEILSERVKKLIEEDGVGIGQLFRYLSVLPSFELEDYGKTETTFWRAYTLSAEGEVACHIHEEFPLALFELNDTVVHPQLAIGGDLFS